MQEFFIIHLRHNSTKCDIESEKLCEMIEKTVEQQKIFSQNVFTKRVNSGMMKAGGGLMEWLKMNYPSVLVVAVIVVISVLIVIKLARDRKSGRSSCGGCCGQCPSAGLCQSREKQRTEDGGNKNK